MPVYARSSGQWVQTAPLARAGGQWTDTNDNLFARDAGLWKLIYPDPASIGDLLGVEGLAVTAGPTHNSVTIGWTNPTQPTVTPTDVQVRLAELGAVWTETALPKTSESWGALDPQTEYVAQVRLVRRVDGVVTDTSPVASVQFTTTEAPVGAPAPDPGGSGGDTTFPGGGTGGNPIPGGGTPGTNDACWWEWKFQIIDLTTLDWIETGITGTQDGSSSFVLNYDVGGLDATRTYRVCYRTACDTDTDGVADQFGVWECGDPFIGGLNWDLDCAGIGDSTSEALAVAGDAIFHIPDVCTDENDTQQMFDLVSGTQVGKGSGFYSLVKFHGEWSVVGAASIIVAQPVLTAYLTAIESAFVVGADHTVTVTLDKFSTTAGRSWKLLSIGLREFIQVDETATGYTVSWLVALEGGLMTLTSAELDAAPHSIQVRWDDDGDKDLWVDGELVASDSSGETFGFPGFTGDLSVAAGPLDFVSRIIGWDRALTDDEMGSLGDYDSMVQGMGVVAYYPQGGVVSNGSYSGGSGGSREVVWDGSTGYIVHTLNDAEQFTPEGSISANVLRVAGGGAGGAGGGGGGGAGGEVDIDESETISSAQTATVGTGGAALGDDGGDTTFNGRTALGGPGGGQGYADATPGENGGSSATGSGGGRSSSGGPGAGGVGSEGGSGGDGSTGRGGGGGGAGVDGQDGVSGAAGGDGVVWSGDGEYYGGGGGGGVNGGSTPGHPPGGLGGGGRGAEQGSFAGDAEPGEDGRGGGGGGNGTGNGAGGGGGTVKVRYEIVGS